MSDLLATLRGIIHQDVGNRGLGRVPGDNLFCAWPDDLLYAARSLAWHPRPHLVIVTGFPIVREEGVFAETDGPLGARFLARAFRPLGIRVTLAAESFWPTDLPLTDPLPVPPADMTHLLSLERVGPSWQDGRCYSMRGKDVSPWVSPVADWFEAGRPPGVVTIGIGDGGNEIGMGKISREVIARNIPLGETIACRVATDHLIVAATSNWGAYALAAAVYHLRGAVPAEDLFDPQREAAELRRLVDQEKLIDGKTGKAEPTVDGLPLADYLAVLPQLKQGLVSTREANDEAEGSQRGAVFGG